MEVSNDKKVFMDLIRKSYKATSDGVEDPQNVVQYKTSRELQYELRESCEPSLAEISQAMMELKFQGIPKGGTFYWMVYEV